MIFTQTGGLTYHLRALRFFKNWKPHRDQVAAFLDRWDPKKKNLILVGPSGGYSLPAEFLKKFETITAFEPDSVARFIFEKRMGLKVNWKGQFPFERPEDFSVPDESAILFCNLLGQIPPSLNPLFSERLIATLQSVEWASFHDAISTTNSTFSLLDHIERIPETQKWSLDQIQKMVRPRAGVQEVQLIQHLVFDWFRGSEFSFSYWIWELTPKASHLIEGVYRGRTC